VTASVNGRALPLPFSQLLKRIFLGQPLVSEKLKSEALSNPVALGALAPDAISSTAYGPEQILLELLPKAGMAGFILLLPILGVILLVLAVVAVSYRQVVMAYTQAGGSYIVARENFGPRVAQIAAAALLIDYVVTVAVQTAAGTVAVASALPALGPYTLEMTVGVVVLICYMNLRGAKEAGRPFAVATYSFVVMIALTIVVGVVRHIIWGLPTYDAGHVAGMVPVHQSNGLVMGATILVLLRAFANGGSSLTGVEGISNTVNSFRDPKGINARRVLTAMACILGFLLTGVGYLAYATHATPYRDEYPSVLAQIARAVFGHGLIGNVLFILVQVSTAAILYTGANTSFNGFPALSSFVAEDRFLPGQLMKRGYRLVFSNGIITLAVLALVLLLVTGGSVDALIPLYAIGVFTGFSMAGYGMTKYHLTQREQGWRRKLVINLSAGVMSTIVVGIFAVAKFTEGAWLIVVIFPILVFALMRINHEYRAEAEILEKFGTDRPSVTKYPRHRVFAFVNAVDLAALEALRYGKGLGADELIAVHFVIDATHSHQLQELWDHLALDTPLRLVDCPDRQLARAAQELITTTRTEDPDASVTVLLPRRSYGPVFGRLLHGHTADKVAKAVGRIPDAAATIVPYDVQSQVSAAFPNSFGQRITRELAGIEARILQRQDQQGAAPEHPETVIAVNNLVPQGSATIEGQVTQVEDVTKEHQTFRSIVLDDGSGKIRISFRPGHGGEDIQPGQRLRITGEAQRSGDGPLSMADPTYHVVE